MLFVIIYILHINLSAISFNRNQDLGYTKNSGKTLTIEPPCKLCLQKLYQCHLLKQVYCMQNFVLFHAIEPEIGLSQEFWKKMELQYLLESCMHPNYIIVISNYICVVYKFLRNFI